VGPKKNVKLSGLAQDQIGANPDGPTNSNGDHNNDPTFPRWSRTYRNQARMSRLNYRKINSYGSLLLRRTLLSYLHVMPHGQVYKA
jgi:hypothetical protein